MAEQWTIEQTQQLLKDAFAPWIQALNLRTDALTDNGGLFTLPGNPDLSRRGGAGGGVVCGQAVASAADTCSVMTLVAHNGTFRPCTTVDLTSHFMRPLPEADVEVRIEVLSNGRRMAMTRAEFRGANGKLAATATLAFAYLD
ncbi:MAG: PaaI family thioesterase [Pseudomonadota bacterium]